MATMAATQPPSAGTHARASAPRTAGRSPTCSARPLWAEQPRHSGARVFRANPESRVRIVLRGRLDSGFAAWRGAPELPPLILQPLDEPTQDAHPHLLLADRVLDAVLDVGIVLDLHHPDAVRGLLEVDAVEAVADRLRRPHGEVDDLARRLVEIE